MIAGSVLMTRRGLTRGLCVLALSAFAQMCSATVIYSDLGSGPVSGVSWPVGTFQESNYGQFAVEVIPTEDALAGTVNFWASSYQSSNEVTIEIASNNGGVPGTVLTSQTEDGVVPEFGSPITTVTFSNPVSLTSGTDYWVVFSGPNLANFEYDLGISATAPSSVGNSGAEEEQAGSGGWGPLVVNLVAFDLTDQTNAPEPGTLVSASLALLFLIGFTSWRKRRQRV